MRPVTTPLLAVLLVVALVVGTLGGYLVASRLNNSQVSQSAFVPYNDNYGGHIDDSQKGYVTSAPLVAGFSQGLIAWYWLVGPTNSSVNPVYFFEYQNGGTVTGQYPIVDVKPQDHGYTHFWELYNVTVPNSYTANDKVPSNPPKSPTSGPRDDNGFEESHQRAPSSPERSNHCGGWRATVPTRLVSD